MIGIPESCAIAERNAAWAGDGRIPGWVDISSEGLDLFYTSPAAARACLDSLLDQMAQDGADPGRYTFVEPAAGQGAFYDLLPHGRRIGVDVFDHGRSDYQVADFLSWAPPGGAKRIAVVGNPPFGSRGWLALAFVNHAAAFADYVGLILPMAFQSDGKGSPKPRVEGLRLMHTETLPPGSFSAPDRGPANVNACWQVWQRGVNNPARARTCDTWIDVFSVDERPERRCGHNRIGEADWFLDRTFYPADPPKLVGAVDGLRSPTGHGLVILRDKEAVTGALRGVDWRRYSNVSADNRRHIGMGHIKAALVDAGYDDGFSGQEIPNRRRGPAQG